jgi:hypothetical protein
MPFPKAVPAAIALLESLVPAGSGAQLKPMFGHKAAFVNGHMVAGTFGDAIIVRLGPAEHAELLAHAKASVFEPMPGRPMKGYVRVAPGMPKAELARWVAKALAFTKTLPAKAPKSKGGATGEKKAERSASLAAKKNATTRRAEKGATAKKVAGKTAHAKKRAAKKAASKVRRK